VEHETTDRIGRERAVAEEIVEARVASDRLIAAVRLDESTEGLLRQSRRANRPGQPPQQRVARRLTGEDPIELPVDLVEEGPAVPGRLVSHVVGEACEAVEGPQVVAQVAR
jgi:hypothetical protein